MAHSRSSQNPKSGQPARFQTSVQANILFEDEDLLALDKPAGWLSHASVDRKRIDALSYAQGLRASCSLSLIHRLDVETTGVLLFSKNPEYHEAVSTLFRERQIQKIYLGVTNKRPRSKKWTTENHLASVKVVGQKTPRSEPVRSGGEKAITHFQVLDEIPGFFLIEARPLTGRRHQIRSHLQTSGIPLNGDVLYGGSSGGRVLLHASRLTFKHPRTQTEVLIHAPLPTDFPFGHE